MIRTGVPTVVVKWLLLPDLSLIDDTLLPELNTMVEESAESSHIPQPLTDRGVINEYGVNVIGIYLVNDDF